MSSKFIYFPLQPLIFFCRCGFKQHLKTMIDEAVDDIHTLPTLVMESGREIPITADTDVNTIKLNSKLKSKIPDQEYYNGMHLIICKWAMDGFTEYGKKFKLFSNSRNTY